MHLSINIFVYINMNIYVYISCEWTKNDLFGFE